MVYSAFGQVVEGKVRVERPVPEEEKRMERKTKVILFALLMLISIS